MVEMTVNNIKGILTHPSSMSAPFGLALAAGILNSADANPEKPQAISGIESRVFNRGNEQGTLIQAEMTYDNTLAITTDPVVNLVGRYDSTEPWRAMKNKNGTYDVTMTTAATDIDDGALIHTRITDDHTFDTHGFNEFAFVVKTAAVGSGAASALLNTNII